MPITVSCPACGSRFSLSDDLYRRRVAGSLVKVKCRNCNAEIAVDATELATMPSHESTRKHPIPPRPKAITQIGLGPPPPPPAELATSSPLPLNLTRSRLPSDATITPLPTSAATATPLPTGDPESIWSDEETIAIDTAKAKAPPRPPVARTAPVAAAEEPELIEAEEIPASSSDAPTLDALTLEAGGAHVPHGKPAPDEFLVSLSGGGDGMLGAPTIDVTSFAAEINPPNVDVPLEREAKELDKRPPRTATIPLFDMSAVLPAASQNAGIGSDASTPAKARNGAADPSLSEGRSRERKFVIPPKAADNAIQARRWRRPSALLWVSLLTAAGAVGAGIGFREHRMKESLANEPPLAGVAQPAPTPVVKTQAALPAEPPATEPSEAASGTAAASATAPVATAAPAAHNVTAGTTQTLVPSTTAAVKSNANEASKATEQASRVREPAVEESMAAAKAVEAHNAPPPAGPDTEFDRAAARNALASAAAQASSCRKQGDPSGTANLTITFAPSGRVTSAQIQGPPFSGTPTGGCIASTMRRASVPAFSGDYVTVSKTIVVQ